MAQVKIMIYIRQYEMAKMRACFAWVLPSVCLRLRQNKAGLIFEV